MEVASGSKGSNSDYGGENEQGTQIKCEKANTVEVVVIHVVAVEVFFVVVGRPMVHHLVADTK